MSSPTTTSIGLRWGSATHVGHRRTHNEDAVLAEPPIFAVADGMGGQAGGGVAAALAVAELGRFAGTAGVSREALLAAVAASNLAILRRAEEAGLAGMGTTLTGVALLPGAGALLVFNVGDSRVYGLAGGTLRQLTVDHSVVQELVDGGLLGPGDAASHPARNVITRTLGVPGAVEVDTLQVVARPGERFVLCSDGLVVEVGDDHIAAIAGAGGEPGDTARALVDAALAGRGRDNVTVVVLDVVRAPAAGDGEGVKVVDLTDEDTDPRTPVVAGT